MNDDTYTEIPRPKTDERRLWDIILGQFGYKTLLVAHQLKLFDLLAQKPRTIAEICEALKIDRRPADAVLAMCSSMGLMQVKDGYYSITTLTEDYLIESSPAYFGGYLQHLIANDNTNSLENLKKAVLTNSPQAYEGNKVYEYYQNEAEANQVFISAMHAKSMASALAWPEVIDLSGYSFLLDIGGGSGAHAIAAISKWSNLQASILELPHVCEIAQEYIKRYGLESRISTQAWNMWNDPFPPADIHFYSSVYHNWPPEKIRFLTQKSFESLSSGGRIIIHETLYDDEKANFFPAAAFSIFMLLWNEGQQYSGGELSAMLKEVGFTDIEIKPTFGYWSIVTGRKP